MILRQWGGSSHLEPPHLCAATFKNTAGAGRIFDLEPKCFQTLFSGLKDEVPALKETATTGDFTVEGRMRGTDGCCGGPTCPSANPSRPLVWPVAAPPLGGHPAEGLRLLARAAAAGPLQQLVSAQLKSR